MASAPHVVIFPFMSKGHTIPLLHLARLLLQRNASITIFTTPANRPFISLSLSDVKTTIIDLPFPENITGIPPGIESTDKLPDISLWQPLARATKLMKPHFVKALQKLPPVTFMVSDGFLWWTIDSATKFNIPTLVSYGMSNFARTVCRVCVESGILRQVESDDDLFPVPHFPWVKLTRNDFEPVFYEQNQEDPHFQFIMDCAIATNKSYAMLVNSFCELEQIYLDYHNNNVGTRALCVGPLCLAERPQTQEIDQKPPWIQWLDDKLDQRKSVLYVAFGSQAEISSEQLEEIKNGLEKSEVNFLWVIRKNGEFSDGFEERVKDRGLIVKEWVNQRQILSHQSVQGFLSHCGWGSVIESICAKVPILAWPMMAEQPLNARFVAEEIKIGIVVETCSGSINGFVKWEGLRKCVKELMEGEMGKKARKKVEEFGEVAIRAMEEGGSSRNELDNLLKQLHV